MLRNSDYAVLFRRQVGTFYTKGTAKPEEYVDEKGNRKTILTNATRIACGVVGQYDWDGYKTMVITPEMVGQKIAVYIAIESKSEDGRESPEQKHYGKKVRLDGGIAFVVNDENQPPAKWEPHS